MKMKKNIIVVFALFSFLHFSSHVFADMGMIQERLVNTSNVISKTPFTTIASCVLSCSAHDNCSAIGFDVDPALQKNSDCLLLKKVEKYGIEEDDGLVSMFVMIRTEDEFVTTKPDLPECPADGGYGDWSAYTTCTATCGDGTHNRSRECNNPFPRGTGLNCSRLGSPTEQKTCNVKPCPIDGGYGEWGSWGPCSQTCGTGTKASLRLCDNPTPQHGGKRCMGNNNKLYQCYMRACIGDYCHSSSGSNPTMRVYDSNNQVTGSSTVGCIFEEGFYWTTFDHDAMTTRRFDKSNYKDISHIRWTNKKEFVREAVQEFDHCRQYISFKARNQMSSNSCFITYSGTKFCMNSSKCKGCEVLTNSNTIKENRAVIEDKNLFPFTGMQFLDNDSSSEFMEMLVEKLRCR